ncbi:MAG: ABC transporter ATP-binding protein/permease [Candidatus Heimdallarchaeota archaeon]|nr:ABC transporter ATP-binding protein/permease [Candidatus Heimdallarchaeota archaeon]MDH5644508.1 ABC transporter ATP-binding protein/permease [Candidatus Heimdallarchaeota archaeon]
MNITTLLAALSQLSIPLIINYIIDDLIVDRDKKLIYIFSFILLFLGLMDLLMNIVQRYVSIRFSNKIIYDIRQDVFTILQHQDLEYYSSETVGQIMARSIYEITSLRDILTWAYRITFLTVFLFIGSIISMFIISPLLSMGFLVIPPILYIYITRSSESNSKMFYNARYKFGELNDALAENLAGIKTVKAFAAEHEQIAFFTQKNNDYYYASMKTAKVRANMQPVIVFIISISLFALVFLGGYLITIKEITIGNFISFMLLSLQIAIPGRFLGWIGIIVQESNSAAIRLNEIFHAPIHINEADKPKNITNISGKITYKDVSFGYPKNNHTLHSVNLEIPAGQKVALLGETGSGKSTLINLIPRFFDPDQGSILIDDINTKQFSLSSLRSHIGIVHQEAFLFTLSIFENIAFGIPNASKEDVIAAAKAAQIHDFIMTLEKEYDTIVGERGVTLSGGQRQRVTIARTLLLNPKILIFDDSVSAVDPETESKIQEALEQASFKRTTLVISQRPSSLRYVDRIIVLNKGRIVQDGKHDTLIKEVGIYRDFINAINSQIKFMDWDESLTLEEKK